MSLVLPLSFKESVCTRGKTGSYHVSWCVQKSQRHVHSTHLLFPRMLIKSQYFYRMTAVGKAQILMLANKRSLKYNYKLANLSNLFPLVISRSSVFLCRYAWVCVCGWHMSSHTNELIEYRLCDRLCVAREAGNHFIRRLGTEFSKALWSSYSEELSCDTMGVRSLSFYSIAGGVP